MEKEHKKMYKAGKNWVVATLLTASLGIAMGMNFNGHVYAKADSVDNKQNNNNLVSDTTQTGNANSNVGTQTGNNTTQTVDTNVNVNGTQTGNNTTKMVDTNGNGTQTVNNTTQTVDTNVNGSGTQTGNNTTKTVDANDNGKQTGNNNTTNQQKVVNNPFLLTQQNNVNSNVQQMVNVNNSNGSSNDSTISNNLKNVDGHYIYTYPDGTIAKSTLMTINGNNYYFNENGYLTDLSSIKPTFFTSEFNFNPNSAIYKKDGNNITNTNGFITANSWYRPKKILKNGTKWVNSRKQDFRPILSIWWPNKNIQTNYVNYMNKLGLGNGNFNQSSTQESLNVAAQEIQKNIEKRIHSEHGKVSWLNKAINKFIKTQPDWNIKSENYHLNDNILDQVDGLQGGTLLYKNSQLTPYANSNYRLLNRSQSTQSQSHQYNIDSFKGDEFLLANDVDNSNPTVQAENLNWLYYLMNFGKIIKNDSNANFDSIRIDAPDNIDADVLNTASDYINDLYHTNKSGKNADNHISILEDWSGNDTQYMRDHNSNQITMDLTLSASPTLKSAPQNRNSLSSFINTLVNRSNDNSENTALPNYEYIRAHDYGIQDVIATMVNQHMNSKTNGYYLTNEELNKAISIFNKDEKSTNKQYTQYNIPSSYALMLTNKDTIPRVNYSDMYTINGQFMAHKSVYFNAINAMLRGRIKYVSGGQSMNMFNASGNSSSNDSIRNQILTSVRYGKGALSESDKGNSVTRKSGIATVVSNDPNLQLTDQDYIVINMGSAHKNQLYRPILNSSKNGLKTYKTDSSTNIRLKTNNEGQLILTKKQISGYSNPQLSGYLSMWVPVGANKNQDVRTKPSNKKNKNGRIINSNAATDSNVMFEAFSNFQSMPTKKNEYENVILPKKAQMFKNMGITYMQLPPQYRSVTNDGFLDAKLQNGYAFNDRYDLGFKKPTKYGTANDLINTIKALHNKGMKVMADYVVDQLYSLPRHQVVKATKVNNRGVPVPGSNIDDSYYYSNTLGNGKDYQFKYGGKFLSQLKRRYPDLFNKKQISNGESIDSKTKLKTWSSRYLNGTNVQGNGAYFVLRNINNSGYFVVPVSSNKSIKSDFLPKNLLGKHFKYGLYKDGNNVKYTTSSGYNVKNSLYEDKNGYQYYFDGNGNMVTSPSVINGKDYYFFSNGVNLNNSIKQNDDGTFSYYSKSGDKVKIPGYYSTNGKDTIYVQSNGKLLTGLHSMKEAYGAKQYFNNEGIQIKGTILDDNGQKLYLDPIYGSSLTNIFVTYNGKVYYAGSDGYFVTGSQNINGYRTYFNSDNTQAVNQIVDSNGNKYYYDDNGHLVINKDINVNGVNYHADGNGILS